MRVLVTTDAVASRLYNLVPTAWALRSAGHEVCVAGPLETAIRGSGLTAAPAADVVSFARVWRPDLVLWDSHVQAGPAVAERIGVAGARVLSAPDSGGHSPAGLTIDPLPGSVPVSGDPGRRVIRHVPYDGVAVTPAWLRREARRPRVAVKVGRAAIQEVLAAVAGLDVEVIAILAADQVPPGTRIPGNVRLLDHLSLTVLLPACSAVVHDGDLATAAAAVVYGVPQLEPPLTAGDLGSLLEDRAAREQAARRQREMLARPGPHDIVPDLEELAHARSR
ncbi:nucleotide disphospho-sugar-binding domain-containing protein [Thermoactinospora rubra]|uniref:nucleotide disphospho-sugar-binding domain-containing protein n=1 Tax=Thermoactinospora rubra TaxID=1088767 RepID=UPI000A0FB03F|nr:nucleotide disphospho-sugar-binding domain-containing protein [Thermoactinospora rubra]